jgi:hypothetical protein
LLEKDAHEFFTRGKLSIVSCDGASRLSSRAQLAFFASEVEGSTRSDFFSPAGVFQAHRFALIPLRVRCGWCLAHLVGMTDEDAREKIDSLYGEGTIEP